MKIFKWIGQRVDGHKLWSAVTIAIGYGIGVARAKYPQLPWDEVIIPALTALGLLGGGHKVWKSSEKVREKTKQLIQKINSVDS